MKKILDFIVIGAQKAGTTSLFEYLRRHPDLRLPVNKEAAYFSHDAEMSQTWSDYLRINFATADADAMWGTVSPSYMTGGIIGARGRSGATEAERAVPQRIHERLPAVKLIALLRDPVERAISHHKMMVMNGVETRSFDAAIDELLLPGRLAHARAQPSETTGYVAWGEYGRILGGYLSVFAPDQLLIAFSDELDSDPAALLRQIHRFIGVTPDLIPDNLGTRYREGGTARRFARLKPNVAVETIAEAKLARALWHSVPIAGRERLSRSYASAAYRLDLWNRSNAEEIPPPGEATLRHLRAHFASDGERISALAGRPPPWHANWPAGSE
jgi:hypothetical protein